MKKIVIAVLVAVFGFTGFTVAQGADGERFYGRAEYLYWWTKDSPLQTPLVTDGFISDPTTRLFLGGQDVDLGARSGARLTIGYWLSPEWGVEASGFYLPKTTERQSVASTGAHGSTDLVVPFFDPVRVSEAFSNVSLAGSFSGVATQEMSSRLWGAEGNLVFGLGNTGPFRIELLGGFRYLNLSEGLSFTTSSPDLPPSSITVFATQDVFDTKNEFYGGQIGLRGRYQSGRFMADATLKAAVGVMRQNVDISGGFATNFFTGSAVQAFAGGLFAQPTNIGSHRRDVIAVVPEVGVNVGFKLTDWASIIVGYTFLYANNVARPGNQIDRTINPTQSQAISLTDPATLTGAARPEFKFKGSDFWAHGLNAGLAFSF